MHHCSDFAHAILMTIIQTLYFVTEYIGMCAAIRLCGSDTSQCSYMFKPIWPSDMSDRVTVGSFLYHSHGEDHERKN